MQRRTPSHFTSYAYSSACPACGNCPGVASIGRINAGNPPLAGPFMRAVSLGPYHLGREHVVLAGLFGGPALAAVGACRCVAMSFSWTSASR